MKSFLLFTLLLLSRGGFAQLYAYHVSGPVFLKNGAATAPLRSRQAVVNGQHLVLKSGAQVVLIDAAGRNISYTKPGVATYATLQKAFQDSQTSTTRAYLAYVWKSLNHHATAPPQQANAPVGGVARGNVPLLLAPADSAVLATTLVAFKWQPAAGTSVSWFTLTDATGDPLLQLSTTASSLELNMLLTRFVGNRVYYWTITATPENAANAPRRAFVLADGEGLSLFAQELTGLPVVPEAAAWQQGFRAAWFFRRASRQ